MEIRKSLTAVGAALMVIGISAPAAAFDCSVAGDTSDPVTITTNLIELAEDLRCAPGTPANPGNWSHEEIWQKRGDGDCAVQDSLAKKLNEEREFDENSKPPRNKNNTNTAAGAAGDVRNAKYLSAVDKLDAFIKDVYKSRLNVWETGNDDFDDALGAKLFFVNEVNTARACVCKLTECE